MNKQTVSTQVAIIGSGPGGLSAAVAAAREGAKALLVEQQGFVGGNLASGLPYLAFLDAQGRTVTGGFAQMLVDRLIAMGGAWGHRACPLHNSVTSVNGNYARLIAFQLIKEHNIDLLLHCQAIAANVEDGRLKSVTVSGKGTQIEIFADVFVDGTGDGDLSFMAGARYEKGQRETGDCQPPSLLFDLGGVDLEPFFDFIEKHPEEMVPPPEMKIRPGYDCSHMRKGPSFVFLGLRPMIKRLRAEGKCPIARDTVIFINQPTPGHVTVNSIRILNFDSTDVDIHTKGEIEANLQIMPVIDMLKENVPGFANCYLSSINPAIGIRESRRIMGVKMLAIEDAMAAKVPDDSIGLGSYIIDIHSGTGETTDARSLSEPYGIPYGCLVSADIANLMLSGRIISVDPIVFGSTRIMPTCMAAGEAAGVGAALAVKEKTDPADVDVSEVRRILSKNGAILSL